MKNLFSLKNASVALLALAISVPAVAQETDKKTEVRLNLVKEVDGQTQTLDTIIFLEPGQSAKDIVLPAPWNEMTTLTEDIIGSENVMEIEIEDESKENRVIVVKGMHAADIDESEMDHSEHQVWVSDDGKEINLLKGGQTIFIETESDDSEDGKEIHKHVVIIGDQSIEVKEANDLEFKTKGNTLIEVREGSSDVFVVRVSVERMTEDELDELRKSIDGYHVEEDGLDLESLNVYPNPSNGEFSVSLESSRETNLNLYVFNQAGQRVFTEKLKKMSGSETIELDLTNQPAGVYYVNLTDGKTSSTRKVVIE